MDSPCFAILETCSLNQSVPTAYPFLFWFSSTVLNNSIIYKFHNIHLFFNECFNTVPERKPLWHLSKFKWPVPTPCKLYGSIKVYLFKVNSSQNYCILANLYSHLCLYVCVYMHIMHVLVHKKRCHISQDLTVAAVEVAVVPWTVLWGVPVCTAVAVPNVVVCAVPPRTIWGCRECKHKVIFLGRRQEPVFLSHQTENEPQGSRTPFKAAINKLLMCGLVQWKQTATRWH